MCAHMHVWWRVGEKKKRKEKKNRSRSGHSSPCHHPGKSSVSAPARFTLSLWDKGRFHGGTGRNTKRQPHGEKRRNDARRHRRGFGTLWVIGSARRRRWREPGAFFSMHHRCNVMRECGSHTGHRMGNVCAPLGRMYYPLQRRQRTYCVAERPHKHTRVSLVFCSFFLPVGFEERLSGVRGVDEETHQHSHYLH